MISDKERREVAKRLKILASHAPADKDYVLDALGLYPGEYIDGFDPYCVNELANLIDRPTCRVVKHETYYGSFGCEEAGELWTLSCGDECINDSDFPPSYCPECGAMVIDEEEQR